MLIALVHEISVINFIVTIIMSHRYVPVIHHSTDELFIALASTAISIMSMYVIIMISFHR